MVFTLLSIGAIGVAAVYLGRRREGLRRGNAQSWDSLVERLRPNWNATALNDSFLRNDVLHATPEEKWNCVHGAQGLWNMHENARVMMAIADFAARNGASVDQELIAALRSDALQIRIYVLRALVHYAFSQVNESISANALHAASMYTEMASRMKQLLEVNAAGMLPASVGAM
jgi:hypothetical protein